MAALMVQPTAEPMADEKAAMTVKKEDKMMAD